MVFSSIFAASKIDFVGKRFSRSAGLNIYEFDRAATSLGGASLSSTPRFASKELSQIYPIAWGCSSTQAFPSPTHARPWELWSHVCSAMEKVTEESRKCSELDSRMQLRKSNAWVPEAIEPQKLSRNPFSNRQVHPYLGLMIIRLIHCLSVVRDICSDSCVNLVHHDDSEGKHDHVHCQ